MTRITIDPITRLEGHGRIEIFLSDQGTVENVCFQVPELRGFEQFCVGRMAEEMPVITNRICGICPEAHHLAASKALDALFGTQPPPTAKMLRELLYMAFFVSDHATHFYALGGPDFIVGPDAPPSERNILGVARKLGVEVAGELIACRKRNHEVIRIVGGRGIHPVAGIPGGWSRSISEGERVVIAEAARMNVEFAKQTLALFERIVLDSPLYQDLLTSDVYLHRTYSMGTVDGNNQVNFYDGNIRVIDPDGEELVSYHPNDYCQQIAERVEPWTYLKFPYLKKVGWLGLTDGVNSGLYTATPLSRLNASEGMPTPLANAEYQRMYESFGCRKITAARYQPIHHRMATHWARLIELLYAAERMLALVEDRQITSKETRIIPRSADFAGEGIGSVEAPRGTLTHHYVSDGRGLLTKVNMIVGTTNNHAAIAMSIKRAAEKLITSNAPDEAILNRIEMAFRLYDPCLSCATHHLPGKMPMVVSLRDNSWSMLREIRR
ncbi:MAG: Ni/Fe hydrogenase subunit alpha [Geobacter sp.]|nr:Ni/Fe hydrogenase subunit alpha [Geobacter sp.]